MRMLGLNYYECMKSVSLWFNDIEDEIKHLAESTESEGQAYNPNIMSESDDMHDSIRSLSEMGVESDS